MGKLLVLICVAILVAGMASEGFSEQWCSSSYKVCYMNCGSGGVCEATRGSIGGAESRCSSDSDCRGRLNCRRNCWYGYN